MATKTAPKRKPVSSIDPEKVFWIEDDIGTLDGSLIRKSGEDLIRVPSVGGISLAETQLCPLGKLEIYRTSHRRIIKCIIHHDGRREWVPFADNKTAAKRKSQKIADIAANGDALFDPNEFKAL